MPALIAFPRFPIDSERRYRLSSREKTTFHTVLDAKKLLDPTGEHPTSVKITAEPDAVRLAFEYPLARGPAANTSPSHANACGVCSAHHAASPSENGFGAPSWQ